MFGVYVLTEAVIQLMFHYVLNYYGEQRISNLEFHGIMWIFQCLLIWPIWWVAFSVCRKPVIIQVVVNLLFFLVYSAIWFGPVQEVIRYLHMGLQQMTRNEAERLATPVDSTVNIHYQVFKHSFRLSWFFLANYFYHYRQEEAKRLQLALANKELQLKLLTWHLNPAFYFRAIDHLKEIAAVNPSACTGPILQLAKVMEYVIYETKEKWIDVKKEIQFLKDYIHLHNRQGNKNERFRLMTEGNYEHLRIAPLLMAGFIDRLSGNESQEKDKKYQISLLFTGPVMEVNIQGESGDIQSEVFKSDNDMLITRLNELYPGKFNYRFTPDKKSFQMNIQLHE